MILYSGDLLLTPGFFTDAVVFALLYPAVRRAAYQAIRARVNIQSFDTGSPHAQSRGPAEGDVIDGDFHEIKEPRSQNKGPSGWTKD
jgi:UPF0716 protein FxsA